MMYDQESREYLEKATVGAKFFYGSSSRWGGMKLEYASVVKVERETKTQLILSNGERINRKTGNVVGKEDSASVATCTPGNIERRKQLIEGAKARKEVHDFKERLERALRGDGESLLALADRPRGFDQPGLPPVASEGTMGVRMSDD